MENLSWLERREIAGTIASEALDGVLDAAGLVVYQRYLEKKGVPFAVESCLRQAAMAVAWSFMSHDPGEADLLSPIGTWGPDEEPEPPPIDNWARFVVPERENDEATLKEAPTAASTSGAEKQPPVAGSPAGTSQQKRKPKKRPKADEVGAAAPPATGGPEKQPSPSTEKRMARTAPAKVSPKQVAVGKKKVHRERDSEPEERDKSTPTSSKLPKEYTFSHTGSVIPINPIPPEKLPPAIAHVRAVVVEDDQAGGSTGGAAGSEGKPRAKASHTLASTLPKERERPREKKAGSSTSAANTMHFLPETGPPSPALIDSMKLAPGVTVREGSRVKYGSPAAAAAAAATRNRSSSAPSANAGPLFPPIVTGALQQQQQQPQSKPRTDKIKGSFPKESIL